MYQTPEAAASTIGFTMGYGYAIRAVPPQGKTPEAVERQISLDEQIIASPSLQPTFRQRWRKGYHCWHIQQIAYSYVESTFAGQQFVCGETRQQGDDEHSPWRCEFLVEDPASGQKVPYRMHIHWATEVEGIAVNWWMISTLEKEENAL